MIVDGDPSSLIRYAASLATLRFTVTAVQPLRPLQGALRMVKQRPSVMVIALDGDENLVDIRSLLRAGAETKFVFLIPSMPPKASLVRIADEFGATILAKHDAPLVLAATVVAMFARTTHGAA